jgi:hypothetical protein
MSQNFISTTSHGLQIKLNNYGFPIDFYIQNADGTPKDLTGLSAALNVWANEQTPVLIFSHPCQILNATQGVVEYVVQQTDFTQIGTFYGEIELTGTNYLEDTLTFTIEVINNAPGGI